MSKTQGHDLMNQLNYAHRLGDRRLNIERRRFHYSNHIPERRSGNERRESEADMLGPETIGTAGGMELEPDLPMRFEPRVVAR